MPHTRPLPAKPSTVVTIPTPDPAARLDRPRKVVLAMFAILVVSRFYWPSDAPPQGTDQSAEAQWYGSIWVLGLLLTAGVGIVSNLIAGTFRFRWSWSDLAVIVLTLAVGLSATHAQDRRPAINLAWEWGGFVVAYLLARNLPRSRSESLALGGILMATAVAVSAYGLYQVGVEYPETRAQYRKNPGPILAMVGIEPGTAMQKAFEDRLLGSNEPMSTFALTNSLAGFLVGPAVLALALVLENLVRRSGRGSPLLGILLAAAPGLILGICLLLTKSRSAYLGLLVATAVLLWRRRGRISVRTIALTGAVGTVLLASLVALGWAMGQLDRQVLTESTKSLSYRLEYWTGAWRVIREHGPFRPLGLGPGNFETPYLKHKVPTSSEEIKDPHNLILDVWASGGLLALIALTLALGLGWWAIFGRPKPTDAPIVSKEDRDATWLMVSAGVGGWIAVAVLGPLDLGAPDALPRWLILGAGWAFAATLCRSLWRGTETPLPADAFGAATLAVAVNLLAAGGIGMPSVALGLWVMLALGQNLQDDRPCGRLREVSGLAPSLGLAAVWAAVLGTFFGAILPFWKAERHITWGWEETAMKNLGQARIEFFEAVKSDAFSPRPFLALSDMEYRNWTATIQADKPVDPAKPKAVKPQAVWDQMIGALELATKSPRNPDVWTTHRKRAAIARETLARHEATLTIGDILKLKAKVVEATRTASRLYPSNAMLHAELAIASAEIGKFDDAETETRESLRLDRETPHMDKKLNDSLRRHLERMLPVWADYAKNPPEPPDFVGPRRPRQ